MFQIHINLRCTRTMIATRRGAQLAGSMNIKAIRFSPAPPPGLAACLARRGSFSQRHKEWSVSASGSKHLAAVLPPRGASTAAKRFEATSKSGAKH
jgi:hypothetical protein